MSSLSRRGALALPLGLLTLGAGCAPTSSVPPMPADPTGRADAQQRVVLEALAGLNPRPIETLSAADARRQPSYADAVTQVAGRLGRLPGANEYGTATDLPVTGAAGPLRARLYRPVAQTTATNMPVPIILYFHGGGWVIADIATYEASARALSRDTGAMVLAVHYRQGPEARFPAAHDDANAAYRWTVDNARALGGDPGMIAVVGESAGGNLALNVGIFARDSRLPPPRAIGAVYPVAGTDTDTPSYREFATAKPLNRAMILWFVQNYTRGPADLQDPRLDIYGRANLAGLPPIVLVNAEIDPLRSDGTLLAARLRAAGTRVTAREYPGVTHEFFGADAVLDRAKEAQAFMAGELRTAFAGPAPMRTPARPRPRV